MQNVIFISGVYGVGKSTLCSKLSSMTGIPAFSAGDLISEINGEVYGRNKVVKDAKSNQDILISAVDTKLKEYSRFLLAGHFCIVDRYNNPGPEAVTFFAEKLDQAGCKYSKGSIQIPYSDELPLDLIAEIADWCRKTGNHA